MKKGFTLIELLVGILITSVILVITTQQEMYSAKNQRDTVSLLNATNYVNEALDVLETDFKNIGFGFRKNFLELSTSKFLIADDSANLPRADFITFKTSNPMARALVTTRLSGLPSCATAWAPNPVSKASGFNGDAFLFCHGKVNQVIQCSVTSWDLTANTVVFGSQTSPACMSPDSTAACYLTGMMTVNYANTGSNIQRTVTGLLTTRNQTLIRNGSISFSYYDANNNLIATPSTTNTKNIRAIQVTVNKVVDLDPSPVTVTATRLIPLENILGVSNND